MVAMDRLVLVNFAGRPVASDAIPFVRDIAPPIACEQHQPQNYPFQDERMCEREPQQKPAYCPAHSQRVKKSMIIVHARSGRGQVSLQI